ncbi:CC105 protein, partial [Polypterus senegalus]
MPLQPLPIATVTIGPQSWRNESLRAIQLANTLVQKSESPTKVKTKTNRNYRSQSCDTFIKPLEKGTIADEAQHALGQENEYQRPCTAPQEHLQTSQKICWPLPFLRVFCADESNHIALAYMRDVRLVVSELRQLTACVNEEVKRLIRGRESLEKALACLRKDILMNQQSIYMRTFRPAINEKEHDGADTLLDMERKQLSYLKFELEAVLKETKDQQQTLCACRKNLLTCVSERSRVLDLIPNAVLDTSTSVSLNKDIKPNPIGPFTPECKEVIEAAQFACAQSRELRQKITQSVASAKRHQQAADKSVNDGVTQKVAETVGLMQRLNIGSGQTRNAIHRVKRWYDETELFKEQALGPTHSSDFLSREKLDRPLVQVYQRHPGTQLPEAAAVIQGCVGFQRAMDTNNRDIGHLNLAYNQLEDDFQRKKVASKIDSAVVRMRRRYSNHRWIHTDVKAGDVPCPWR